MKICETFYFSFVQLSLLYCLYRLNIVVDCMFALSDILTINLCQVSLPLPVRPQACDGDLSGPGLPGGRQAGGRGLRQIQVKMTGGSSSYHSLSYVSIITL